LATEVVDQEGNNWPVCETVPEMHLALHRGRLLAVPHLVGDSEQKCLLGQKYDALAVDMETAMVARICSRYGVPFHCVRAISDEVDTALSPRLISLLSGGGVSPLRLLVALASCPRLIRELWTLAKHTRLAAQQLGKVLWQIVMEPSPGQQLDENPDPATS
jgi:hypothetical protein